MSKNKRLPNPRLDEATRETVRKLGVSQVERPFPIESFLRHFNPLVEPHKIGLRRIIASLRRQDLIDG